ncbi:MAG: hypothetical protein Q4G43_14230, partial [Mobilicoccus sp.]|nr:hypothetical protein [Mobilicoccus sp.]
DAVATTVIIGRGATAQATVHLAPDAWRDLSEEGLRVILTHECVHVALVPATSSATPAIPLWLLEGVAEYVAYAASSVPTDEVLTPLWQQVAREGPPQDFPDDADFTAGHSDILLAYAKAHTAARSYVQRHSEEELVDLVLDTEADRAARVAELLPQWQADLREDAARVGAAQE